jgi:hypothetical protein
MRIGRRVAKVLLWTFVFCLLVLAGSLWAAYSYLTNSETAVRLVRQYASKFLPSSALDPGMRVRLNLLHGDLTLINVLVNQRIDERPFPSLHIPWLRIGIDPKKLLKGQLELRQVSVAQPKLRLCHRRDGTLNLKSLLADPWPGPLLDKTPPIVVEHGTLEVVPEDEEPANPGPVGTAGRPFGIPPSRTQNLSESRINAPVPRPGVSAPIMVLRDVSLRIEQVAKLLYKFDGSAQGDSLEQVHLSGTVDLETGRTSLSGKLTGLTLSDAVRRRIPREVRPIMKELALTGGVIDIDLKRATYDPAAPAGSRLRYAMSAWLRDGVWECPRLPFPVNKFSANLGVEDGRITIEHAEGYNGGTTLRAKGTIRAGDPRREPLDLHLELIDLDLDWHPGSRLRSRTPAEFDELWDVFQPNGLVDAQIDLSRTVPGSPIDLGAKVTCKDVAAKYRHFAYQLDHLRGQLELRKNRMTVDVQTLSVGGRPLHLKGTIVNPGIDALVDLELTAESVPIEEQLLKAFKPDVQKVVAQFDPKGTVRAHAKVSRRPMAGRPEGQITIDSEIDLSERCEIRWAKLPYPIRNLTGRLELHPDLWIFRNMRGENGQAKIIVSGQVQKLGERRLSNGDEPLKVHVDLEARNLPFSQELRSALPGAWEKTWKTINPSGACDVEASVDVEPYKPDRNHIVIVPLPESSVRLEIVRAPQPAHSDPGGMVELRMDDVRGRFIFDNGHVNMSDVSVQFRGAPVRCDHGTVFVEDTGRFALSVTDLWVKDIRLDLDLRKKMPPLMAQFAQKVDDGKTYTARGNLKIGWSGNENEPAWCQWEKTLVVFNDNRLSTGIPLEHIQGEIDNVSGWSNGLTVRVEGIIKLESVVVQGQQITKVESPFRVHDGIAELVDLRGHFLGGDLWGKSSISLDETPSFSAMLSLQGARLEEYARTIGGRRTYRGIIDAHLECSGMGSDLRTLQGQGAARITQGELGKLPFFLRIASLLNLPRTLSDAPKAGTKTAFDSADVAFTISHGHSTLDPIKFTGNTFSLQGRGTLDPQADLDLRLRVLLGRNRFPIPVLSDLIREAGSQILIIHVTGTPSYPDFKLEPLPQLKRDPNRGETFNH